MFRRDQVYFLGNRNANILLVQMMDEFELQKLEEEVRLIRKGTDKEFGFLAIKIDDWNKELSPWKSPAVFGKEDFGDGASQTLQSLEEELIPYRKEGKLIYLGGYSLAGLFSLWCACKKNIFAGIAAVSPSVWFPGFKEYLKETGVQTKTIYLSLGTKEEKTKNKVMAKVGHAIREIYEDLNEKGCATFLEWNEGNHFSNPEKRTAKGFIWLLNEA